eukprot:TRINITY_DN24148_c0_g1_i1.p1 TRINITY_DN24148_c0_g1~~TRINITY_DN24148_c0_g1_i1.p1  ORF type:complete len:322 (-),score=98.70 TRINITY_DN24148_c0_g1_i1:120-1016(-)
MSLSQHRYGKSDVRVLKVIRNGDRHEIFEMRVRVLLSLYTIDDYTVGDNRDIVATDTVKNTVYVLARRHKFDNIETFALIICQHFIDTYKQVADASAEIDLYHWERQTVHGKPHNHAFVKIGDYVRYCRADRARKAPGSNASTQTLSAGFKGLDVLKTTQSGFEGYHRDEYTTLRAVRDRMFRTTVQLEYVLNTDDHTAKPLPFDHIFQSALRVLQEEFSGEPGKGVYSPSVQQTQYNVQKSLLAQIPQVMSVNVVMPNRHCLVVDLSPFKLTNDNEIFVATDEPAGHITSTMVRSKL